MLSQSPILFSSEQAYLPDLNLLSYFTNTGPGLNFHLLLIGCALITLILGFALWVFTMKTRFSDQAYDSQEAIYDLFLNCAFKTKHNNMNCKGKLRSLGFVECSIVVDKRCSKNTLLHLDLASLPSFPSGQKQLPLPGMVTHCKRLDPKGSHYLLRIRVDKNIDNGIKASLGSYLRNLRLSST